VTLALLGVGVLTLVAAVVWFVRAQTAVVLHTIANSSPAPAPDNDLPEDVRRLKQSVLTLAEKMDACMKAVAEGIDHVERNEKRVRGILTGAKRRFETAGYEDPGVEAEVASLPAIDEGSRGPEELQPVPEDVEMGPWASVPGMRSA